MKNNPISLDRLLELHDRYIHSIYEYNRPMTYGIRCERTFEAAKKRFEQQQITRINLPSFINFTCDNPLIYPSSNTDTRG